MNDPPLDGIHGRQELLAAIRPYLVGDRTCSHPKGFSPLPLELAAVQLYSLAELASYQ